MIFREINNWKNISGMKGLLFFIQRLEELTFSYTLDSYKSPAMSLQSLIFEAYSLLQMIEGAEQRQGEKILNSVEHVFEEIRVKLKGNWIVKSACSIDIDTYAKFNRDSIDTKKLIRDLDILHAELSDVSYFSEIVDSMIKMTGDSKNKRKIELLAREFSMFLQNRGVSRDHINNTIVDFFFDQIEIYDAQQLKDFCQIVYPHNHDFVVIVGASDIFLSFDPKLLIDQNIIIVDEKSQKFSLPDVIDFKNAGGLPCLMAVLVQATDYNSALSKAVTRIESFFNFYRIFNHRQELEITTCALVEQACCEGVRKKIEAPKNNMHFIRDMRSIKAATTLKRFADRTLLNQNSDSFKFFNIINIHGMSLETKSPDIQLVNLWTCLETITPGNRNDSKISNVVDRVIPIIMLGYYNRLITNALFDALRWNRREILNSLKKIKNEHSNSLKDKFIELLSSKECEDLLKDLYIKFGDFELLRFRVSELSEIVKNPIKAQEKIQLHENMVKWQLHRIYRTRNSIVHSGSSHNFVKYLVENAHDYFDQVLLFCLEVSSWKSGFDTFLMCFDFADMQYKMYKNNTLILGGREIIWTLPKSKGRSFIFNDDPEA